METPALGAFQREYSAAGQGRYEVLSGGAILLVILGVGAFALYYSKPGQLWLGVALFGVLAGALGGYIYGGVRKLRRRVLFHADGMILHDGGRAHVIRWADVAALRGMLPVSFGGSPAHVGGPLSVEMREGRIFRLPFGYQDPDVLANFLHEKVLAHLLPAATEALRRGGAVDFGLVRVDRAGIHQGERTLPWSEYRGVSFTADDLQIAGPGQTWASLRIARMPNANLFLHLARAVRG